ALALRPGRTTAPHTLVEEIWADDPPQDAPATGTQTRYAGTCPPPAARAPAFTARFTVGRLPTRVEYRWVLAHGSVSDPGWRTLSFPAGGARTREQRVTVTTYAEGGTVDDEIGVEVRGPVRAASDSVPFSVTCTTTAETPSSGTSASPSGSP
ncbi:serine/threonine protein kinase, partial [Streptomyces sp. NPDC004658]